MFAYIIIGIELIVLYLVFWIVFIREPRPCEIRAELWGRYANSNDQVAAGKEPIQLPTYLFIDQEKLNAYLPSKVNVRSYKVARSRRRRHRANIVSHACHCSCSCHEQIPALNTVGWGTSSAQYLRQEQLNRNVAEKFLLLLNRTLNKLSVKVP